MASHLLSDEKVKPIVKVTLALTFFLKVVKNYPKKVSWLVIQHLLNWYQVTSTTLFRWMLFLTTLLCADLGKKTFHIPVVKHIIADEMSVKFDTPECSWHDLKSVKRTQKYEVMGKRQKNKGKSRYGS